MKNHEKAKDFPKFRSIDFCFRCRHAHHVTLEVIMPNDDIKLYPYHVTTAVNGEKAFTSDGWEIPPTPPCDLKLLTLKIKLFEVMVSQLVRKSELE